MEIVMAVGIAVFSWIITHPLIIAVIIAVVGWVVTHFLNIRAQNKNFKNQIVNNARLEITKAIRDYQDWLGKVLTTIRTLRSNVTLQELGLSIDWLQKMAKLTELFHSDRSVLKWVFRLEEYEILFPETAQCRRDLLGRHRQIQEYLGSFLGELRFDFVKRATLEQRKKTIEKVQNNVGIVVDQRALMEDLRIYLQNRCLSSLTGNKIPERKPEDLSRPRLVQDKRGNLQIIPPQNTTTNGGD